MVAARTRTFVATPEEAGERVDRACAARLVDESVSRSAIARLCERGLVRVGGEPAKASQRLRAGDAVDVEIPPPEPLEAAPEALPLTVLHEDDALLVIDKPAGMVVHPARGHASGTLVNAVLHHATLESDDVLRPGVVHRLDKDTSGVLVVAKTDAAREALKAQFKSHTIERAYLAITVGVPPEDVTFDTLHGRHPTDRKRFTARVREGKRAVTHVTRLEVLAGGAAALVRCRLETGRTHQIRMHLSEAGFPILGDPVYGRPPRDRAVRAVAEHLGRQALHATVLGFVHPRTREPMRFETAPPPDFTRALESLRVP